MQQEINSRNNAARLAGLFWLLNILTTAFSLGYVRSNLIVWTDVAATAANIAANESLFRTAIVSNLFSQVFLFLFGLAVFRLFKPVNKTLAIVFLTSVLITVAVAVVNSLNNIGALVVMSKADYLNAFGQEQLNALMMLFLRLNNHGQGLLEIFWLFYFFSLGLLIIKSKYVPAVLGVLLIIGSFGFPINTFTKLLLSQSTPAIILQITQALMALGSIPIVFWLLIKGVREQPPVNEI